MVKKKVAIVYGGELGMATKTMVEFFGFEYIQLPPSIENFRCAKDHFPEEWCFDIKLMYADLLKGVELGADYVISLSSGIFAFIGPCRLPFVAETQLKTKIEQIKGKEVKYVVFKFMPQVAYLSLQNCCQQLGLNMYNPLNQKKLLKAIKVIKYKFKIFKKIRNKMRQVRSKEIVKGSAFKIFKEFEEKINQTNDLKMLKKIYSEYWKYLKAVPQTKKEPLKIGLVGDMYSIFWDFPVFDLENYICSLFNVEIVSPYSFHDWYFSKKWRKDKNIRKRSLKYLKYWAGGTDAITLKSYLEMLDKKVDGIMQLRTFGCMPEEVSSLAIQAVNQDQEKEPNFMILSYDDHSNSEGLKTRVEAFCNTILRQKNNDRK